MRWKATIVLCVLAASSFAATPFGSSRLGKIAAAVRMKVPDTMKPLANVDTLGSYGGRRLRVRTNQLGDISHVGYKLFSDQLIRAYGYSPAFDFLERYLLELDLGLDGKTPQQRMDVDRVMITKGNMAMLKQIGESTPLGIEYVKRRLYRVTWIIKGKPLTISFQADCQLLMGCDALQLEQRVTRDVPRQNKERKPMAVLLKDWSKAKVSKADSLQILDDGNYLSNLIVRKLYVADGSKNIPLECVSGPTPVVQNALRGSMLPASIPYTSAKNVSLSVNNIMQTGFYSSIPMDIVLDKYGYKVDTLHVTLRQFLAYCEAEHDKIYMGIKKVSKTELSGTLFILNEQMAYNHVLSFEFPLGILQKQPLAIKARLYAYIPLQNVTEKFFNQHLKNEYKR